MVFLNSTSEANLAINGDITGDLPLGVTHGRLVGVSLTTEKVLTILAMTAITFLFGMLPLKLFSALRHNNNDASSRRWWKNVISFCSCFSGGVFIAACILDLLPDVEEKIDEIRKEIKEAYDFDVEYPLAHFIMCVGFFIILTIEQLVLHVQENWIQEMEESQSLLSGSNVTSYNSTEHQEHGREHHHHQHQHTHHQHPVISGVSTEVHHTHDGHGHNHTHMSHSMFQHSTLRSIMLLLALSFHSVFEGIAIGLQDSSANLLSIFIAVITHKAVMAFSLGLNIAQSELSLKSFVISNIIFSLASPIGVGIGIGMEDLPSSLPHDIANGILQGIAGGTFLYITFFEVLPHELNVPSHRLWKVLFVMLGFSCICGLLFIAD